MSEISIATLEVIVKEPGLVMTPFTNRDFPFMGGSL